MPTIRRMTRTARLESLTDDQRYHLLKGYTLLSYCDPYFGKMSYPFRDDDHRKKLWEQHRAELMAETGSNRRCHGWWCYSAPDPRRRIIDGDPSLAMWEKGESFGRCRVYNIESWSDPRRPIFETQKNYLKRHGLL